MLTERRKADRTNMAAMVVELCEELGATVSVRDCATHVWDDGSRASPENRDRLVLTIRAGDATVGIDFDRRSPQPDVYCTPWNVAHDSDARFSAEFGRAVRASVNAHHRKKCMGFADGIQTLLAELRAAIECVNRGEAFLVEGAPIPFEGPSHDPDKLKAAGFEPIGDREFSLSAAGFQRAAYDAGIPQAELTGFRHPDGWWQMYRRPVARPATELAA